MSANIPDDGGSAMYDYFSPPKHFPLHVHISLLFTLLLLVTGLLIGLTNYLGAKRGLLEASREHVERLTEIAEMHLDRMQTPVANLVGLLARTSLADAATPEERMRRLPLLLEALSSNAFLYGLYAGYPSGDFFMVRHLRSSGETAVFGAPPDTRFLIQSMVRTGDVATGTYFFLDGEKKDLGSRDMDDASFDPRTRSWYGASLRQDGPTRTAPYIFYTTRDVGQTFACRAAGGQAVLGADIILSRLSETLAAIRPTPSAHLLVFDRNGQIVADSEKSSGPRIDAGGGLALERLDDRTDPLVRAVGREFRSGAAKAGARVLDSLGREWTLSLTSLERPGNDAMFLSIATPLDELLRGAWTQLRWVVFVTALILLFSVPLTWRLSRRVSRDLRTLAGVAEAIRRFDFSGNLRLVSWVTEVQELSDDLTLTQTAIRKFLELSARLSSERDFDRLEEFILLDMLRVTEAKAGALYLLSEDGEHLSPAAARMVGDTSLPPEGENVESLADAEILPLAAEGSPEVPAAMAEGRPRTAKLAPGALPSARMRQAWGAGAARAILVPLRNNEGDNVGLIALYKPEREGEAAPSPGMLAFVRQLSGVAAVALENHRLFLAQEELMRGMIKILAGAIDAKSPYTGGHCQRVPVIAEMLAEAACAAETGPFADYQLDKGAWDALHVAAWLHDCGKVTTPEYVVDKATKLEAIYDRIHEVRMRFEVAKREAEIACLKTKAGGGDPEEADRRLAEAWRSLDDDFAFVAQCNEGGESMRPESLERLAGIARRTWTRTLSDRLGLSWEEKRHRDKIPEPVLPAVEPLLADKPEHLIPRPPSGWSKEHNPWGFTMKVPEYKFNRGELANLSIARGTLSEEERFIINDHIIQSIIMLSRLPFPGKLRRVPEIAGGHHERMDGKGYPRGLTGAQMSTEARMMAVADVFEALTAADRPYKKAKPISESLSIMARMAKAGHLDPQLFELFLAGGVHMRYARQYLAPEQIDAVDVEALLAAAK